VTLYKEGESLGRKQIRVRFSYYANVLVTVDKIRRNDIIVQSLVDTERREITFIYEKAIESIESIEGFRARRNIGKDQILTTGMLERIPVVEPGREVSVLYKTAGFEITASGIVLENGYIGDNIRIRYNHSNKVVACTVLDEKTVQVPSH
jgi:flagella basal body P-ring formation protein FlgA